MSVFVVRRVLRKLLLSTHTLYTACLQKLTWKWSKQCTRSNCPQGKVDQHERAYWMASQFAHVKKTLVMLPMHRLSRSHHIHWDSSCRILWSFYWQLTVFFSFWRVLWPTGIKFFWYKLKWVALRVAAIQVKITANASLFWKWLWLPYWNHQEIISLSRDPHQKWQSFSKVKALGSNGIPEGSTPISLATGECSCFEASTNINQE